MNMSDEKMFSQASVDQNTKAGLPAYLNQVFLWMMFALALSGAVAYLLGQHPVWEEMIVASNTRLNVLWLLQLAMVVCFRSVAKRFFTSTVILYYALYAALTGITFSIIFYIFTAQSILGLFIVSICAFGGLALFGFVTRRDLNGIGRFCTMGAFGLLGFYLLSMFIPSLMSSSMQQVVAVVGLIVFSGFTMYDMKKLKAYYNPAWSKGERTKEAIFGGLMLYIDFINIFLSLLRLFGGRR